MPQADMREWLEKAVENEDAHGVSVRCGPQSNPRTIGKVFVGECAIASTRYPNFDPVYVDSWEEAIDTIDEMLDGAGYGVEPGEECARIHLLGETGAQLRTWSRTKRVSVESGVDTVAQVCSEMIRMCAENRRALGVVTNALADQAESRETAIMEMISAYRGQVESQAQAELVQVLAEVESGIEHEDVDPLRTTAAGIIQNLAAQFLPNPNGAPVNMKSVVLETLRKDPLLVRELIEDNEVLEMFSQAQSSLADLENEINAGELAGEVNASPNYLPDPLLDGDPTPNPMDE